MSLVCIVRIKFNESEKKGLNDDVKELFDTFFISKYIRF